MKEQKDTTVTIGWLGRRLGIGLLLRYLHHRFNQLEDQIMSLQDDVTALSGKLDTLGTAVSAMATDLNDLSALVAKLQASNPTIDLSPLSAKVDAMIANAQAALAANPDPGPQPA